MDTRRVKVYKLNDRGLWDDKGTGHVNVEYMDQNIGLIVTSEDDNSHLLEHTIVRDSLYQRQGDDTIISWTDPELGTDVALSFQESAGCDHVWRKIIDVQDNDQFSPPNNNSAYDTNNQSPKNGSPGSYLHHHRAMIDEFDTIPNRHFDDLGHHHHLHRGDPSIELPQPELSNLHIIAKILNESNLFHRDALSSQLLSAGYINKLLECFRTAEDIEDIESLHAAHAVVKAAILLNETSVLDVLFSDEYIIDVVGALEYDPEVPESSRISHRQHIHSKDALREVVPIVDPGLRYKIIQSYRMGYVKDAVLPRSLDDATFATLSSLQLFNNVEVLLALHTDQDFFPDLLRRLKEAKKKEEEYREEYKEEKYAEITETRNEWKDLVGFLQELISLARHLQAAQRNALLVQLVDLGLYEVLAGILKSGDADSKLRAADILLAAVAHDPAPLRAYLLSSSSSGVGGNAGLTTKAPSITTTNVTTTTTTTNTTTATDNNELFGVLVSTLLHQSDDGVQEQVLETLKILLDPETMESSVDKDRFIDAFYNSHIGELLRVIVDAGTVSSSLPPSNATPAPTLVLVLELLCYCVSQHSYRIKYYILRNNVVEKVLRLLPRREAALSTAALRFLRTCLALRDEFYNRYLVKNSLLEPVITAFLKNKSRYNLFNSAALELFEFIRKENMKGLLALVVESPQFSELEKNEVHVNTFSAMKVKYEININSNTAATAINTINTHSVQSVGAHRGPVGTADIAKHGVQQQQNNNTNTNNSNDTNSMHGGVGINKGGGGGGDNSREQEEEANVGAEQRRALAFEVRRQKGEKEEDADEENYFREDDSYDGTDEDDSDADDGGTGGSIQNITRNEGAGQLQPRSQSAKREHWAVDAPHMISGGRVVLESSPPLLPLPGRLVDYGDDEDEDDTLPLNALSKSGGKRLSLNMNTRLHATGSDGGNGDANHDVSLPPEKKMKRDDS